MTALNAFPGWQANQTTQPPVQTSSAPAVPLAAQRSPQVQALIDTLFGRKSTTGTAVLPPHLQAARANDPRQRQLAMLERNASGTNPIQSGWQGVAKLANAWGAKNKREELASDYEQQASTYQQSLGDALTQYQSGDHIGGVSALASVPGMENQALALALKGETPQPETFERVDNPFGRGGTGQQSLTSGRVINYQGPEAVPETPTMQEVYDSKTGQSLFVTNEQLYSASQSEPGRYTKSAPETNPFSGNGMDAQTYNILLQGDPASDEYAAAYAHQSQPRTTVDAKGNITTIQPDMSVFRAPEGVTPTIEVSGGVTGPDVPQAQEINVPGATVTQTPSGVSDGLPTAALQMQDEHLQAIGTATEISRSMTDAIAMIDDGKLELGPLTNLVNEGQNYFGMSDEGSRAFGNFKATMEKLRNDSLRLNNGVQTEGDAQRAWNEIMANMNDSKFVKERLEYIQGLNDRANMLRQTQINTIRQNFGLGAMDPAAFGTPGTGGAPRRRWTADGGLQEVPSDPVPGFNQHVEIP